MKKYTTPPQLNEAALIAHLETQPDIVAAYLFGSMAQGRATPHSDVDLAVLLNLEDNMERFHRRLALMRTFDRFADREVDVIVLNDAPPLLCHQVLKTGRLLYEADRAARIGFEVRAGKIYADLKPMWEFFNQDLARKIKEVGLGKRRQHSKRKAETTG